MKKNYNFKFALALLVAMLTGVANMQAASYDLWIRGVQVTDENKNNLSVIGDITGSVSYNSTSQTLRLENATITQNDAFYGRTIHCIHSAIDGLTIELVGNNKIENKGDYNYFGMLIEKKCTIKGNRTLTVMALNIGIKVVGAPLIIEKCNVNVNVTSSGQPAYRKAILGTYNEGSPDRASLIVDNAAIAVVNGPIQGFFSGITLTGSSIIYPSGAKIVDGAVCDASGNIINSVVNIAPNNNEKYNLWICGTQVTNSNMDYLRGIPDVRGGDGIYNPNDSTLTFDNIIISPSTQVSAIKSNILGLTINVKGSNNNISSDQLAPTIQFEQETNPVITGGGTLDVTNSVNECAIYCNNTSLNIKECTVVAMGGKRGISGRGKMKVLTFDNATVTAKGAGEGSVVAFRAIDFNDCYIAAPKNACVLTAKNETWKAVCDKDSNIIKDTVKIIPRKLYDLYICGDQVSSLNKDNLNSIPGVTGTASYNPDNKILTLDGATITSSTEAHAIGSDIERLTIEVKGNNNNVSSSTWSTLRLNKLSIINGGGTLNVSHTNGGWALYSNNPSLTIENCTVNATNGNGKRGITGNSSGMLTINNATVTAKGNNDGSITHFSDINLINCAISKPIGGRVSKGADTFNSVRDINGAIISDTVKIEPATVYNLLICGAPVTSLNKDDLSVLPGVSEGKVNYNSDTKILTIDGATISTTGSTCCILSRIDGLKIDVVNTNNLTGNGWSPISFEDDNSGTIEGNGVLNLINNHANDQAIYLRGGSLTIKNCTINGIGGNCGILGGGDDNELTFDNTTVSVIGTNGGSVKNFKKINFVNCEIIKPFGALFNETVKAICYADGTIVKDTVKIKPTGTGVKIIGNQSVVLYPNPVQDVLHIKVEGAVNAVRVYNIHGAVVAQALNNVREINLSHLPTGIYMVRLEVGENVGTMRIIKN